MLCFTDMYRITQQTQRDRIEATRRAQLLREARPDQPTTRAQLRHLYGTLMTLLA